MSYGKDWVLDYILWIQSWSSVIEFGTKSSTEIILKYLAVIKLHLTWNRNYCAVAACNLDFKNTQYTNSVQSSRLIRHDW